SLVGAQEAAEPSDSRYVRSDLPVAAVHGWSVPCHRKPDHRPRQLAKPWRNIGGAVLSRGTVGQGWDIRLCGPVVVETQGRRLEGGIPGRQGRLVAAYLILNRERGCPRSELIDLLWPEGPPAAADSALSALLSKLRRALGPGV